ncbi:MAG: hypothetical protein ACEPOZ_10565 [Marinifilaceae bacterium]
MLEIAFDDWLQTKDEISTTKDIKTARVDLRKILKSDSFAASLREIKDKRDEFVKELVFTDSLVEFEQENKGKFKLFVLPVGVFYKVLFKWCDERLSGSREYKKFKWSKNVLNFFVINLIDDYVKNISDLPVSIIDSYQVDVDLYVVGCDLGYEWYSQMNKKERDDSIRTGHLYLVKAKDKNWNADIIGEALNHLKAELGFMSKDEIEGKIGWVERKLLREQLICEGCCSSNQENEGENKSKVPELQNS